jgi:anthranilate phosphoribosyltransferase
VNLSADPGVVGHCIDEVGIGFLFARSLHSAMKHVGPVRAEIGVRTVFNLLGPLTNPAGADGQVMGIYDASRVGPIAHVLLELGTRHAFVVHGLDGLDELTLTGPSKVAEARDGQVEEYTVEPGQLGLERVPAEALRGGDARQNADILRAVLQGERGPRRDIVLLNAAPAIVAGQGARDLRGGIDVAEKSIDSGAALSKLEELVKHSHDS